MLSFRKKLNQLTEFNQAIVYSVEPETIIDPSNGFRVIAQHSDTLDAYLYLQDLLPTLRANLAEQLTPDYLLNVIWGIHERIAKSLMQFNGNPVQIKSGQYTPIPVMRWQTGVSLRDTLATYFSGGYSRADMDIKMPMMQAMVRHAKEQGVSLDAITAVLNALLKIENNPENYPIPENQERLMRESVTDKRGISSAILFLRLSYNIHQFTEEEKREMASVLLIPIVPEKINAAMQAFAERTCKAWKQVDASDVEAVKKMVATVFYELTAIHPFPNGNGRTATALINLMFRALGYPSIVMRVPGDRGNKHSPYAKAMAHIEEDRSLLVSHLGARLADANFSDIAMRDVCCLRFKAMEDVDKINAKYPSLSGNAMASIINAVSGLYQKKYPQAEFIDAIRFIENILHFFATDKNKPLNNVKYHPGLFNQGEAMIKDQERFRVAVIMSIQSQLEGQVNSAYKP